MQYVLHDFMIIEANFRTIVEDVCTLTYVLNKIYFMILMSQLTYTSLDCKQYVPDITLILLLLT